MRPSTETALTKFRELVKKIKAYEEAAGLLYWDMRTGAPRKGIEQRSEALGVLSGEMFRLSISPEMEEYLNELSAPEAAAELDELNRRLVQECKKDFDRSKKIPPDRYQEYVVLTSKSEAVWEEAKEKGDFASFLPWLEKVVAFNLEFAELWGYEGHKYNALLEPYEPGMTVEKLDVVFGELRRRVVPLVAAIGDSPQKPDASVLRGKFDFDQQLRFSEFLLKEIGFDFEAGRLDKSVHPFATGLNPGDVRITTNFRDYDLTFSLFSSLHEGGHALYEQNISAELTGTLLATGTSMGIHESQSRFWENIVGRSKPFWQRYYRDLQSHFPALSDLDMETFYRAVNEVKPSLIRIEADEVTYNLHIMIRYELEKALFSGDLRPAELPGAWNDKYRDYLGVTPAHDGEGVLQDVHWSGGAFGYFPSYSLGNMYAAQIAAAMRREMPDMDERIARGELAPLKLWLTERIYRHGKMHTPNELIVGATGEELNPSYLVEYFERKFMPIYGLV